MREETTPLSRPRTSTIFPKETRHDMPKAEVWTETFRVRSYETDPGGTASITSICNYLQEAAGNHAEKLGVSIEQLEEENLTWVLARLRVEMDALPAWREDVVIETWPSGVERLFAMREFLLYGSNRRPLGRASSAWLMIDRARRRPVRMPPYITNLDVPPRDRPIATVPAQLPDVGEQADEQTVRVRYGDLDLNDHVNNARYAEWSVESLPRSMLDSHRACALDLHFRAEGSFGTPVLVRCRRLEGDADEAVYVHEIRQDGQELARARSVWRAL